MPARDVGGLRLKRVTPTSAMGGIGADAVPLFGRMHQVVADFLRTQSSEPDADRTLARRTP